MRPLAVHLDNGWDSELAVSNIEKALKILDIDLHTVVLDWEEFKDLQIAFLQASTSDAELPTDHAIWAALYHAAAERDIHYVIVAINWVTERILPKSWTYSYLDWHYIKNIHRQFRKKPLRKFPHLSFFDQYIYYRRINKIEVVHLLNFVPFKKQEAMQILEDELGWRPYGGKHYESIYTRFFQGYILPQKFNIDKRKAHLSSLIMSGQTTREQALAEIQTPPYSGYMLEEDMEYFLKKFKITEEWFRNIMSLPIKTHKDYATMEDFPVRLFSLLNVTNVNVIKILYSKLPEKLQIKFRNARENVLKVIRFMQKKCLHQ